MQNKLIRSRKEKNPPPYIELEVSTWLKDSQALYDYESSENKYLKQKFCISKSCKIYRHVNQSKTVLQDDDDPTPLAFQNIYIASVKVDKQNMMFKIQSADITQVRPDPQLFRDHPDLFRNSFLVIRDFQKEAGTDGFPLQVGNYIKFGRLEYVVIEINNGMKLKSLREADYFQINEQVYKVTELFVGSCKICFCQQSLDENPLIAPCKCKGSCGLVHLECLNKWINSKIKKEINGVVITYNFSKFECEVCKHQFPKIVQLINGDQMQMIRLERPERPYLILESLPQDFLKKDDRIDRNLHIIMLEEGISVKIGRGFQCEIRMTDISVSRNHAELRFQNDKYYIKDLNSKFGTLVKFREEIELKDKAKIQYGKACFQFKLIQEMKLDTFKRHTQEIIKAV